MASSKYGIVRGTLPVERVRDVPRPPPNPMNRPAFPTEAPSTVYCPKPAIKVPAPRVRVAHNLRRDHLALYTPNNPALFKLATKRSAPPTPAAATPSPDMRPTIPRNPVQFVGAGLLRAAVTSLFTE